MPTLMRAPRPDLEGKPAGVPVDGQQEVGDASSEEPRIGGATDPTDLAGEMSAPPAEPPEAPSSLMDILGEVSEPADYPEIDLQGAAMFVDAAAELLKDDPIPIPKNSLILKLGTEKGEQEIRQVFNARLEEATTFRSYLEPWWHRFLADYYLIVEGDTRKWRTRLAIPYTYSQINTWVPLCTAAVFDSGSYIWELKPVQKKAEKCARGLQRYMESAARAKASMPRKMRDGFWYSGGFGIGIWKTGWRYREEFNREMQNVYVGDQLLGQRNATVLKVTADHPDIQHVSPWNFFPCPYTQDADHHIPWAIERIETTIDEMTEWANSGRWGEEGKARILAWIEKYNKGGTGVNASETTIMSKATSRADQFAKIGMGSPYNTTNGEIGKSDAPRLAVCVWEMWTSEYAILVANDGQESILGAAPNPHNHRDVPYTTHSYDRIPGSIYGIGIGRVVSPIQRVINFIYNHAQETAMLRRNAPLLARRGGSALRSSQFELRPGIVIDVKDPKDVVPLEIPDVMRDTIMQEQHLLMHADRATGITDTLRGSGIEGASDTATGDSLAVSLTRQRQTAHIKEIRETMARLGRHWVALCQQHLRTEQFIRGGGGVDALDWVMKPEDIIGEWEILPTASFVRSNSVQMQSNMIALDPAMAVDPMVRHDKWLEYKLKVMEVERPEDFILAPPPAPMDPMLEQLALEAGEEVQPSPMENVVQHLQTHYAYLKFLKSQPIKDLGAINAVQSHIDATKTMLQQIGMDPMATQAMEGMFMQAPASPSRALPAQQDGRQQSGPSMGGGGVVRQGATKFGQQNGSSGPPGRSPGPAAAPGRPQRTV